MLGGPPPFRVRDQQGEDLNSSGGEMLGRRQGRRPHTAGSGSSSGAGSVFSSSGFAGRASTTVTSLIGSLSAAETPNGNGYPPVSAGSALAGQLQHKQQGKQPTLRPLSYSAFPAPPSTTSLRFQPQPTRAMKTASPFVIRGGRKYLDLPPSVLPYPLSWDRDILDLQTMDHLELFRVKGGVGSMVDFKGQAPTNVLDLGCGTGTWILDAATQWPDANFVGFDIAPVQLNLHLTNPKLAARVRWVHGNFLTDRLPFADGEFDHVNIRYIARGVPEDKWDGLFEEVRRVLCPGGSLGMMEEDILFPTLPRSFTARTRQRRKTRNGVQDMPKHDHALLEHLFFSVFDRRFINTQPTSIVLGVMNIYFKHCYAGPMWDLPYPPPPLPTDDHLSPMSSVSGSTRSSGPSSPSTSDGLPLPSPIPVSGPSRIARTQASTQTDTYSGEQLSDTETLSPARSRSMSPMHDPNMHDVSPSFSTSKESTDRGQFNQWLQEKAGDRVKHALGPVPQQPRWKPRSLALHLQHAYHNVLAMREAMWDELRMQLRDPSKRGELSDAGWEFEFAKPTPPRNSMSVANLDPHVNGNGNVEHHERPPMMDLADARARFDRLMGSYAADMHARTSVRDALSETLGWAVPPRAPRTKAEIALELDRERERAIARRQERESGFSEDALVCRSHRGLCGFKEGSPTVPVSPA